MAKGKGKGKIHPLFHQQVLHRREDPPSETHPPGSDNVEKFSFLRENTSLGLVVSHCSQPLPLQVIQPLATPIVCICLEAMSCETPVKTSKLSIAKKRKKILGYNSEMKKKIETLGEYLNPIPFSPKKFLDLPAHKSLLTNLGLWDFVNINFGLVIHPSLIEQFVANYNPKRKPGRTSFVDGYAINVSLSKMASALRLPTRNRSRKRKYPTQDDVLESEVMVFSDDDVVFVEELVRNYMVLQDDGSEMPDEAEKIISDVKDRKLDKVDWAGLIWFMMKRELLKQTTLRNCYYASHMQLLIEGQKPWLFDSSFQDARFLEMGSAVGGERYVEDNQLQLLDGNEIDDREIVLVNNRIISMGNDSVETEVVMQIEAIKEMDCAQLSCCTLKKDPSLKLSLVTAEVSQEEISVEGVIQIEAVKGMDSALLRCCTLKKDPSLELSLVTAEVSQEEILVEGATGDGLKKLMTTLFDEAENEQVCDAKVDLVLDNLEEEPADATMDKAGATMDETCIQEVVGKSIYPQGGQENVQENACFSPENATIATAPLDSARMVDTIVLESDDEEDEEKRECQLNCYNGSQGYVLQQQLSLQCVEEDNIEAQSRKGHLEIGDCHGLYEDQSISSQVEDHILPHHAAYDSSVNSGLGMHIGTLPHLYQANAHNDVSLVQNTRPESEINLNLPGSSFNGSLNRQVNCISDGDCENVDTTLNTMRNNHLNEQPMNLDLRSEKVQILLSKLKSAPDIQYLRVANEDLQKKLAQQIHITQRYESLMHHEQEKHKREISMYARELRLMDILLADYKKFIKETDKSKHSIHCEQPVGSKYMDHPDGKGRVITVAEWEKEVQERQNQSTRDAIQSMIERLQHRLIIEQEEHLSKLDGFWARLSGCADSLDSLKAKTPRS